MARDELGYFEGWLKLRRELQPEFIAIEEPLFGTIAGIEVGGTPDRIAWLGSTRCVIDLKCCAASHPGWALQTANYEMLYTKRARCGHMRRLTAQLFPNATYALIGYSTQSDADAAIAALILTEWDRQCPDADAEAARCALDNWKRNHKLAVAA